MNIRTFIASFSIALLSPFLLVAPSMADEPPAVAWPGEGTVDCQADIDVLELRVASLESDNARLLGTLEDERAEHERRVWAVRQANDAEVNELSAALGDADVALRAEQAKVAEADMLIIRQQATIKRLRDRIRSLR